MPTTGHAQRRGWPAFSTLTKRPFGQHYVTGTHAAGGGPTTRLRQASGSEIGRKCLRPSQK